MEQPSHEQLLAFARAMANLAAADGRVEQDERDELDRIISGIGLSPDDEQVRRVVEGELAHPAPLAEVIGPVQSKELRGLLVRMMVELACADGEIAPEERAKVTEAANVFGYQPALVDELVSWVLDSIAVEHREHELMAKLMK